MKIVIPMAGRSRRFAEAGYKVPKPFIPIDGKPMIHRVCEMFADSDEIYLVCDRKHLEVPEFRSILEQVPQPHHIFGITPPEEGPVPTALALDDAIPKDEPVLISYCDFTVRWDYRRFKQSLSDADGAIPCFRGVHPASFGDTYYAYCRVNGRNELAELREKKSFTDKRHEEYASAGLYYFDRWETFAHYARKALQSFKSHLPECYVSLLYNPMVADGKKVLVTEVDKFICWGTPRDLEQYVFWSDYFSKNANTAAGYA